MATLLNAINTVTSWLPVAQQEQKQSNYLTARLWSKYTADMQPTGVKVLDTFARAIFMITALAPTIILTLATVLADAVLITARGIKRGFKALSGTSELERSMVNKAIEILTNKKTLIAAGSLAVIAALGYAGYTNQELIKESAQKLQGKAVKLVSDIKAYVRPEKVKVVNNSWSLGLIVAAAMGTSVVVGALIVGAVKSIPIIKDMNPFLSKSDII